MSLESYNNEASLNDSSDEFSSSDYKVIKEAELYDQLQDHFYDGIIDDETIVKTVFNYVRSNPEKYGFDINWWSVINDLKPQYELEVKDEVFRRTKMVNPDIKNVEDFKMIEEEVHDSHSGYSSVLVYYYTDDELKKYEESDHFKYIVNREAMRQYRDYKRQQRILQDIEIKTNYS